jgi:ribonuclease-3
MKKTQNQLSNNISYDFKDKFLLELALTHRSLGSSNNERLEFLGDSILNFIISHEIYNLLPQSKEGELSRYRADLVKGKTLAKIANELNIGEFLVLGKGEMTNGGRFRSSILANAVEAVIGAIFLDGGIDPCRICILKWFDKRLKNLKMSGQKDPKTELQELMQSRSQALPVYKIMNISGEAHKQKFKIECHASGLKKSTEGLGATKRDAEKKAAEKAIMELLNGRE